MPISKEVRQLETNWTGDNSWPKWLDWIQINGIRGWSGQRIEFSFPIVAIVGENGSGKSSVLQSCACVYQSPSTDFKTWFPTEFFPETAWDTLRDVRIEFSYRQGSSTATSSIRKPSTRWLGQPDRPKRPVKYIDLSRLQPIATRVGYARIGKNRHQEASFRGFNEKQIKRLSQVIGKNYEIAKISTTDIDKFREIPVLGKSGYLYSGFHQGSGEITITELLQTEFPKNGLIIIDEIESSLHPRAQRRLIRDIATEARIQQCQVIISTHSPYILEELPTNARIYIFDSQGSKNIAKGVSPNFAMSKMDDENHPDFDIYVEDENAKILISEILNVHQPDIFVRSSIIPFGAANIGRALGIMRQEKRFSRPTIIILDGDQATAPGCLIFPGDQAPERVVFEMLSSIDFGDVYIRMNREISAVIDALNAAMTVSNHHEWLRIAANQLRCGATPLWTAMCSEWAMKVAKAEIAPFSNSIIEGLSAQ